MTEHLPSEFVTPRVDLRVSSEPGVWRLAAADAPLVVFTTRAGGTSPPPYDRLNLGLSTDDDPAVVEENRRRVRRHLELDAVATARQVHGAERLEATGDGPAGHCDVLVTREPRLALAVTTADCLGVVLWDEPRTALAVVHAGWRGLVAGALESAVTWFRAAGAGPLGAAIGPGIRACCFEVGEEVASRFPAEHRRSGDRRPHLDLAGAAAARLTALGVAGEAIDDVGVCTSCLPALFYSHRRDGGRTGRHWTLARLAPA